MKLLKIFLVICLSFIAVPSFAAEWVQVVGNSDMYYDESSIKFYKKTEEILVWQKYFLDASSLEEYQEKYLKGESKTNYNNYSHNIMYLKVKCRDNTLTALAGATYDNKGKLIISWYSNEYEQKKRTSVVLPKTNGEFFLKKVCKYFANKNKTK